MLPNRSHLQLIVKELEKFEGELDKSYNFQEFMDRCRSIFPPDVQEELNRQINFFEDVHLLDTLSAQNVLYKSRVLGLGGNYVLHLKFDDRPNEKVSLNLNGMEYGLRRIIVWCRKQIIKLIRDEQVEFDRVASIDLESGK